MMHQEQIGLLKESLIELVHVADYCVAYKKVDKQKWGSNKSDGILGYPATIILFSIIDCLGSVFFDNSNFKIKIDGTEHVINTKSKHIFILNSKYFSLDLSLLDLQNLYKNVRSTLTHNSLLPGGYSLKPGEPERSPFQIAINENDGRIYIVNVIPLFHATKKAVDHFIADLNNGTIDFEASTIHSYIKQRNIQQPIISIRPNRIVHLLRLKNG